MQTNRVKLTILVYTSERDDAQERCHYGPGGHLLPGSDYCLLECGEDGTVGVELSSDGSPGSSLSVARRPNMKWISCL